MSCLCRVQIVVLLEMIEEDARHIGHKADWSLW